VADITYYNPEKLDANAAKTYRIRGTVAASSIPTWLYTCDMDAVKMMIHSGRLRRGAHYMCIDIRTTTSTARSNARYVRIPDGARKR
jgi:hypothetical protein